MRVPDRSGRWQVCSRQSPWAFKAPPKEAVPVAASKPNSPLADVPATSMLSVPVLPCVKLPPTFSLLPAVGPPARAIVPVLVRFAVVVSAAPLERSDRAGVRRERCEARDCCAGAVERHARLIRGNGRATRELNGCSVQGLPVAAGERHCGKLGQTVYLDVQRTRVDFDGAGIRQRAINLQRVVRTAGGGCFLNQTVIVKCRLAAVVIAEDRSPLQSGTTHRAH